jgi:predicted amidohydrolase YtcJ
MKRRDFLKLGAATSFTLAMPDYIRAQSERTVVFRGGIVLPVDQAFSQHVAVAIRGNRVLGTGSNDDMMALAGKGAEVVDLDGRTVLPGFIEPHMHLAIFAALGEYADVGPFVYPTYDGALSAIREVAAGISDPDQWLIARQYDPSLLEPARDLTTRELDEIAPNRPAFIMNASNHIAYVNSRFLELAGITRDTPDATGAVIGRYDDGTPNGVMCGQPGFLPTLLSYPRIKEAVSTGFGNGAVRLSNEVAQHGITTMVDMGAGALSGTAEVDSVLAMYGDGGMKSRMRFYMYDLGNDPRAVMPFYGNDYARIAGWKMVTDGSNQGFTGRQRAPYHSEPLLGEFYVEPEDTIERFRELSELGWSVALHGNGDAAIDAILNAVELTGRAGVDLTDRRTRIEHCSILHDDQIARMVDLSVHPSFLLNHVYYWGHAMRDSVFGPRKTQLLDRCGSAERAGLIWTPHSDAPVSPFGALHLIRVAAVRDMWKEPDTILAPDERVTVEQAIKATTWNAAWQSHDEDKIGSLEAGKLADMVILEEDPRGVEPARISDIKVSETWMDGERVFAD